MIEETYVNFEQAKLLKEKGFPQEYKYASISDFYTNLNGAIYEKPSLSLTQKWLREEKEISICVVPSYHIEPANDRDIDDFERRDFATWTYYISTLHKFDDKILVPTGNEHETYEEALSAAINKTLEII